MTGRHLVLALAAIILLPLAISCAAYTRAADPVRSTSTFDADDPAASGMRLTFDDEFDKVSWSNDQIADHTLWTDHGINYDPSYDGRRCAITGGMADFQAARQGSSWTRCGLFSINSRTRGWTQKYGYFEAKIKLAKGRGAWNTWLMYGIDHFRGGAPATELDIIEYWGTNGASAKAYAATEHDGIGGSRRTFPKTGIDPTEGFHRYGVLWAPHDPYIHWYFDGKPAGTVPKAATLDTQSMFLGIGLGADAPPGPDAETPNPMHMYAKYVRVWQFPGGENFGSCVGACGISAKTNRQGAEARPAG